MNNTFFSFITAVLLAVLCALQAPNVLGQTKPQFSDLKLDISTFKDKYAQLEPITFKFKVSNPTEENILGHTSFNLTSNFTKLLVRNENGEEQLFDNFSPLAKQTGTSVRPIKPGETREVENLLNYKLNEMFPSPGKYRVQAVLFNWTKPGKAFSNVITIEITAPERNNLQAFNFIRQSPDSQMFFTGSNDLNKREQIWREFLLKYQDTVYADYVAFALGQFLYFKGDIQESQKFLESLTNKQDFIFTKEVKSYLLEIRRKLETDKN